MNSLSRAVYTCVVTQSAFLVCILVYWMYKLFGLKLRTLDLGCAKSVKVNSLINQVPRGCYIADVNTRANRWYLCIACIPKATGSGWLAQDQLSAPVKNSRLPTPVWQRCYKLNSICWRICLLSECDRAPSTGSEKERLRRDTRGKEACLPFIGADEAGCCL